MHVWIGRRSRNLLSVTHTHTQLDMRTYIKCIKSCWLLVFIFFNSHSIFTFCVTWKYLSVSLSVPCLSLVCLLSVTVCTSPWYKCKGYSAGEEHNRKSTFATHFLCQGTSVFSCLYIQNLHSFLVYLVSNLLTIIASLCQTSAAFLAEVAVHHSTVLPLVLLHKVTIGNGSSWALLVMVAAEHYW